MSTHSLLSCVLPSTVGVDVPLIQMSTDAPTSNDSKPFSSFLLVSPSPSYIPSFFDNLMRREMDYGLGILTVTYSTIEKGSSTLMIIGTHLVSQPKKNKFSSFPQKKLAFICREV